MMDATQFDDLNVDCIREIAAKLTPYDRVALASTSKNLKEELHASVSPKSFEGLYVQDFYDKLTQLEYAYIDLMDTINDIIQPVLLRWHRRGVLVIECGHSQFRLPSLGNVGDISSITYASENPVYPFKIRYQVRHDIEIVYNATSQEFEDHVDLYSHVYANLLQINVAKMKTEMKKQVSQFSTIWNAVLELANNMYNELMNMSSFLQTRYPDHIYSIAWDFLSWKGTADGRYLLHVNSFHSSRYLLSVHLPSQDPLLFGRDTPDVLWSVYTSNNENEIVIDSNVSQEDQIDILGMIVRFRELRGMVYRVYDAEKKRHAAERGVTCIADKVLPLASTFREVTTMGISWWICTLGLVHILT